MLWMFPPTNTRILMDFGTVLGSESFVYTLLWIGHDDFILENILNATVLKRKFICLCSLLLSLCLCILHHRNVEYNKIRMTNIFFLSLCKHDIIPVHMLYIQLHVRIESRLARFGAGKGQDNWCKYDQSTT